MRPTRRTQPYRKGKARALTKALENMLRGEPALRPHPMNARRALQRKRRRRVGRPKA